MIFAILFIFCVVDIGIMVWHWWTDKDVKLDSNGLNLYIAVAVVEALVLVTCIIPPTKGILGGFLFGYWLVRTFNNLKMIQEEEILTSQQIGWRALTSAMWLALVTVTYLGG